MNADMDMGSFVLCTCVCVVCCVLHYVLTMSCVNVEWSDESCDMCKNRSIDPCGMENDVSKSNVKRNDKPRQNLFAQKQHS